MKKAKKIFFDKDIVASIVGIVLSTTPGISVHDEPTVDIFVNEPRIEIKFQPSDSISNIYDVSLKIQEIVYYKIVRQFDLSQLVVNVSATHLC